MLTETRFGKKTDWRKTDPRKKKWSNDTRDFRIYSVANWEKFQINNAFTHTNVE